MYFQNEQKKASEAHETLRYSILGVTAETGYRRA